MKTIQALKKILSSRRILNKEDRENLTNFFKEMQKEGLIIKKDYDLPPLDTIGSEIYQIVK